MRNSYRHFYTFRQCRRGNAVAIPQGRMKGESAQEGRIVSIIEYSTTKKARNSYPHKIVSPPIPGRCCLARMNRIGKMQVEGEKKFYYKRCSRCGFTVREFLSAIDIERVLGLGVSDWDRTETWLGRIQHEVEAERAA